MTKPDSSSNREILQKLSGKLQYRMTNAYLFVAVLQQNHEALCSLIAALLHIKRNDILSIEILNSIILGQAISIKDCVLDLLILLNNNTKINLEMQVANEHNWDNRSVYYLASKLTDLPSGADYNELKPVIQIGILDFNYPSDNREFYQQIVLMNKKTGKIFSDKAAIHVLCLSQIHNATPEDHESGLYKWAQIFKATTWKELIDLADNNPVVEDTIVTIAKLSAEERIRQQCERREKFERDRISAINYGISVGRAEGEAKGRAEGITEGQNKLLELIALMTQAGETDLIPKLAQDKALLAQMYNKYNL